MQLRAQGYLWLEVFFILCLAAALIAACVLYVSDATKGSPLNMSAARRRALEEESAKLKNA
jgi:hypothetical protein